MSSHDWNMISVLLIAAGGSQFIIWLNDLLKRTLIHQDDKMEKWREENERVLRLIKSDLAEKDLKVMPGFAEPMNSKDFRILGQAIAEQEKRNALMNYSKDLEKIMGSYGHNIATRTEEFATKLWNFQSLPKVKKVPKVWASKAEPLARKQGWIR